MMGHQLLVYKQARLWDSPSDQHVAGMVKKNLYFLTKTHYFDL